MPDVDTPCYLIDERRLARNLAIVRRVRERAGVKAVLALKCFSTWGVFGLMRDSLDGTTSSSVYEARLGRETFGKEVHAYCVGFRRDEIREAARYADKVIFNSLSQLEALADACDGRPLGVRVNPGFSYSHYDLADPARRYSRLGVVDRAALLRAADRLDGLMFHINCENADLAALAQQLRRLGREFGPLLRRVRWVSLGGGIAFTSPGYPLADLIRLLADFRREFDLELYLEPGDAVVSRTAELVVTVVDVVRNRADIAIVDASIEAHMLDHLVYRTSPRIAWPPPGRYEVFIAGRSCLAGDVFGRYRLARRLRVGDRVRIADAAGYTMVKKNWFNGLPMPAIRLRRADGHIETLAQFGYEDYRDSLTQRCATARDSQ
ncbi:MAG: carboxynorspermidine decarboxylase [Kiritimatiellae bacterium]|nr:carboxynorspermidine decarboxylase [Kiritimatiellia bacterium]